MKPPRGAIIVAIILLSPLLGFVWAVSKYWIHTNPSRIAVHATDAYHCLRV